MNISKNKTTATAISLFLMFTIAFALAMPLANAHEPPWTIVSYAYVVPAPDPVGVGQRVLIVFWVDTPLPGATVTNDVRRHDYKLTITAPNGDEDVMTWDKIEDPTGVQYVSYTPDQVGEYTILFEYPKQIYDFGGDYEGDTFTAASATNTFQVQEEPLPAATLSYPLPTEYWARPIEGQNTDWFSISSNWLGEPYITSGLAQGGGTSGNYFGRVQSDGIAPNSPHIMWSRPIQDGGVVGGNNLGVNGTTYYMGGSYNTRFSNALIMYGRLYYDLPNGNSGGGGGYMCVDLRTGETIWGPKNFGFTEVHFGSFVFRSPITPSFGYLFDYDDPNQHGVLPNGLLFTSNFAQAIEPTSGELLDSNITGVPSGTAVAGPKGEIIRYVLSNFGSRNDPEYRLLQWNSSNINFVTPGQTGAANWYPGETDASEDRFYDWNVSLSGLIPGTWRIDRAALDNVALLVQGSFGAHASVIGATPTEEGANVSAVSLKPGDEGRILWTKHYDPAEGNVTRAISNWDPDLGVFVFHDKETRVHWGYSLKDGSYLWGPTEPTNDYTYFRNQPTNAYGKIYWAGYGGVLYCYDMKDGSLLWTYGNGGEGNSTFAGLETSWGTYPIFVDVIADGKVYLSTTEHSPGSPFYKDARYRCVNATTGEEIWTLMGWGTGMDATYDRVADGFFVFLNCYDMQVYCVGKGPSATSVSIQSDVITEGGSVLIKGMVTDIAAGTKQQQQAARFPNGVPAVSDESMNSWMEYVYMQKPKPTDVVGVNVTLTVLDPNNNVYDIGTATSDASGCYSLMWEPPVPGKYIVTAAYAGSESFWPSNAATAFGVLEAPAATPEPTPTPASIADMYFVPATVGIIIAIVVVGLLLFLLLRKR
jgi:outer membrane protein assembly factor BamB